MARRGSAVEEGGDGEGDRARPGASSPATVVARAAQTASTRLALPHERAGGRGREPRRRASLVCPRPTSRSSLSSPGPACTRSSTSAQPMSRRAAFGGRLTGGEADSPSSPSPTTSTTANPAQPRAQQGQRAQQNRRNNDGNTPAAPANNNKGKNRPPHLQQQQHPSQGKDSAAAAGTNSERVLEVNAYARAMAKAADEAGETTDDDAICFICAEPVVYWSVSACNHRTCHTCSIRLRALYKKKECTFCKVRPASLYLSPCRARALPLTLVLRPQTDCPTVIFTESEEQLFEDYTTESTPFSDTKVRPRSPLVGRRERRLTRSPSLAARHPLRVARPARGHALAPALQLPVQAGPVGPQLGRARRRGAGVRPHPLGLVRPQASRPRDAPHDPVRPVLQQQEDLCARARAVCARQPGPGPAQRRRARRRRAARDGARPAPREAARHVRLLQALVLRLGRPVQALPRAARGVLHLRPPGHPSPVPPQLRPPRASLSPPLFPRHSRSS